MTFQIRNYFPEDFIKVRDWTEEEKWNPAKYDYLAFMGLNQQYFFIGTLDGQPVASIAAVQYDQNFAFIGWYIVKNGYRGKGYGYLLWRHTIQKMTSSNISLQAALVQQINYKKEGFKTYYKTLRMKIQGSSEQYKSQKLIDCKKVKFQLLQRFDRCYFPSQRKKFLKQWIDLPQSKAIAYVEGQYILGYGVVRKAITDYSIGPLFAQNKQVARQLIKGLIGFANKGEYVLIDIPQINEQGVELSKQLNMTYVIATCKMYKSKDESVQKLLQQQKKVFGVTTRTFG